MRSHEVFRAALVTLALSTNTSPRKARAADAALDLKVVQVARSVDLSRDRQEFLTLTIEIAGTDPVNLRRVQPLRDDFQLLAGKTTLPCRRLQGGSIPEDDRKLRFTLEFSLPAAGVHAVSLRARLPRPGTPGDEPLILNLDKLATGHGEQVRRGADWEVTVGDFGDEEYVAPALPASGVHFSKGGPVDIRVFRKDEVSRKDEPGGKAPARAFVLAFRSRDVGLYDPTLDVTGHLVVDGEPPAQLLSARMTRDPSRAVKDPPYPPFVYGQFFFNLPERGRPSGVVLVLHRRRPSPNPLSIVIGGLPVPGS